MIDKEAFKKELEPALGRIKDEFGIQPNIALTQAAHESRWGASDLAVKANNLFGMSGEGWSKWDGEKWVANEGKEVLVFKTKEVIVGKEVVVSRPFRKYANKYESLADWARLISNAKRYIDSYAAAKEGDIEKYAKAIGKSGYATDPNYDEKILRVGKEVETACKLSDSADALRKSGY